MQPEYDILAAFDIAEENISQESNTDIVETPEILTSQEEDISQLDEVFIVLEESKQAAQNIEPNTTEKHAGVFSKLTGSLVFIIKYIATSACIFGILLIWTNYSAYWNLAYSIIYAQEMQMTETSLIQSVAAASISDQSEQEHTETFKQLDTQDEASTKKVESIHSMSQLTQKTANIDLGIEITPYENRIIIPKIGKNIPLVDIKQHTVEWVNELNDIFMEELENGVIRYPGSAKPGQNWNSFIFGHSSNFPWLEGDYNDVFSLLDHVTYDDEVVIYYGQEKHTYKIKTKNVISPGDVSVLESDESDDKSQLTLMTCWPIGTTLNRLVLTGELISVE